MNDLPTRLSPEEKLLVSLCRLEFSEELKTEIREQITKVKDWDRFVYLANEHGVIALCWYNLSGTGNSKNIPERYLALLHSAYLKSLTHNTFLYKILEDITDLARKAEIKIVLLKGIALEKTLYGNIGLRQLSDIDLLVKKEDGLKFRKILLENGFDSIPLISSLHKKILPYMKNHLPGMTKNGVLVEIHVRLFEQKESSLTDEFYNSAEKLQGDNQVLFYPRSQLLFLYLIKHLNKHEKTGAFQIKFYTDLFIMLLAYPDKIINRHLLHLASSVNLHNDVFEKLSVLEIFWGLRLPEWIKNHVGNINEVVCKKKFIRFLRYPESSKSEDESDNPFKPLKEIPGLSNKILFITGYIFPSLQHIRYRYEVNSVASALLHYPVRWIQTLRHLLS